MLEGGIIYTGTLHSPIRLPLKGKNLSEMAKKKALQILQGENKFLFILPILTTWQ